MSNDYSWLNNIFGIEEIERDRQRNFFLECKQCNRFSEYYTHDDNLATCRGCGEVITLNG